VFYVRERRGSLGATVELLPCDLKVPGLTVETAPDFIIVIGCVNSTLGVTPFPGPWITPFSIQSELC
ncbi:hypothetical protein PIB30_105426, partial [Stylosanthes scabra]|nr:hypothetical protein [Stylosanthes scabra]